MRENHMTKRMIKMPKKMSDDECECHCGCPDDICECEDCECEHADLE